MRNTQGSTTRTAGLAVLPVTRRTPRTVVRLPHKDAHQLQRGDTVALMNFGGNTYDVCRVTYYRAGESVNITDVMSGQPRSLDEYRLRFLMAQAIHHHNAPRVDAPQIGVITRTDGTVHQLTSTGACLQCMTQNGE